MVFFHAAALLLGVAAALARETVTPRRVPAEAGLKGYTFARFAKDYGVDYVAGSEDYHRRAELFEASLAEIHAVNARNSKLGRKWVAGVHPFMDWTAAERLVLNSGYKPSGARSQGSPRKGSFLEAKSGVSRRSAMAVRLNSTDTDRDIGVQVRHQGKCGSCWAFSAVEAVEARLRAQGSNVDLAIQALVNCAPNPEHCGGTGGCDGATVELAYAFMRDVGIPTEDDLPYDAHTERCPVTGTEPWPLAHEKEPQRVRLSGWNALPSNQAAPLMDAVVTDGPVAVVVDANAWHNYKSGVFDGCDKGSPVLGHGVLLKGYGEENGLKYWRIQNSWGGFWGESGHIRIARQEDEDSWCGVDTKPQEGTGCDGGPAEVKVCGTCGILYDPVVPMGVRLEGKDGEGEPLTEVAAETPKLLDAADSTSSFAKAEAVPRYDPFSELNNKADAKPLDAPAAEAKAEAADMTGSFTGEAKAEIAVANAEAPPTYDPYTALSGGASAAPSDPFTAVSERATAVAAKAEAQPTPKFDPMAILTRDENALEDKPKAVMPDDPFSTLASDARALGGEVKEAQIPFP